MRVRLIQPAQLDEAGRPIKYQKLFLPFLTLATLAGLTPAGVDLGVTDEFVENIDFDENVDLVGITAQTCQAPRAYQIADEFRRRGRKTIGGGIHVSMCTEEALAHFDAVLVGEAEDVWAGILEDARAGRLQRVYNPASRPDLSRLVIPRFDLFDFKRYVKPPFARTPLIPIQTTRGCPNRCDFCSVVGFLGNAIRKKPVANVVKEIEHVRPSRIFFTDDNIIADAEHARALFQALAPLRLRWACQMSTQVSRHPELIDMAAAAGCHETFVGVESLDPSTLAAMHKGFNKTDQYAEFFRRLKSVGILAQASVIFGFDGDTHDSLRRAIDTIMTWDVNYLYLHLLVPLPGTPYYEKVCGEGRLETRDWSLYDACHVVVRPTTVAPADLCEAMWEGYRRFYSKRAIVRRAWRFRREYVRFFPRDFAPEEIFFQAHMHRSVRRRRHPFSLGQALNREPAVES